MELLEYLSNDRKYYRDVLLRMTYNTNAIEGNTLSIVETYDVLFNLSKSKMKLDPREVIEVINHKNSFNYLIKEIKINNLLSHELIIGMNRLINDHIIYIDGYRVSRIGVMGSKEVFPYPNELNELMGDLIEKYNDLFKDNVKMSDLAKFHIEFEKIHPFPDGNGRTGRLLLNFILLKNKLPPLVVSVDDKKKYIGYIRNEDVEGLSAMISENIQIEETRLLDFVEMKKEIEGITVKSENVRNKILLENERAY